MGTNDISNVGTITGTTGNFTNLIGTTGNFTNLAGTLLTPLPITIQDGITKLGTLEETLDMGSNDISSVGTISGTTGNFTIIAGITTIQFVENSPADTTNRLYANSDKLYYENEPLLTESNFFSGVTTRTYYTMVYSGFIEDDLSLPVDVNLLWPSLTGTVSRPELENANDLVKDTGSILSRDTVNGYIDGLISGQEYKIWCEFNHNLLDLSNNAELLKLYFDGALTDYVYARQYDDRKSTSLCYFSTFTATGSTFKVGFYYNGTINNDEASNLPVFNFSLYIEKVEHINADVILGVTNNSGTNIVVDTSKYDGNIIDLTGNLTLGITGGSRGFRVGRKGNIILKTNGTGRSITFSTSAGGNWLFEGGSPPSLSLTDTIDLVEIIPLNTTEVLTKYTADFS